MPRPYTGIPAASGYPQLEGSFSIPHFSDEVTDRFYCDSVVPALASTKYEGEFKKGGDTIIFRTPPRVTVRPYIKDAVLKADTLEMGQKSITINRADYFNLKIDDIDMFRIQNWSKVKASFEEQVAIAFARTIECDVLGNLYAEAHCKNSGIHAGCKSGAFNLGDTGQPVAVTPANINELFVAMSIVLDEQCVPAKDRWVVVPPALKQAILNSPLACADCSGDNQSMLFNGELPAMLAGFKIYVSNNLMPEFDAGVGALCYHLPFGWKEGVLFATQMTKNEVMRDHASFDTFFRGYQVWGWDCLYNETLGAAYVRIN